MNHLYDSKRHVSGNALVLKHEPQRYEIHRNKRWEQTSRACGIMRVPIGVIGLRSTVEGFVHDPHIGIGM